MKRTRAAGLAGSSALLAVAIVGISLGSVRADVETDFVEFSTAEYVTFGYDSATARAYVQYTGPNDPVTDDGDTTNTRIVVQVDPRTCEITNRGELGTLLEISSSNTGGRVQLYENGLGAGRNKCTPADGRVADGSWLRFEPGTALTSGGFTAARLNVEGKFGTTMQYTVGNNAPQTQSLGAGGDNGNDATGDNYLIPITATGPFQSLQVSPVLNTGDSRSEIAVDNGGDTDDGDAATIFYFGGRTFDYTVDCGETARWPEGQADNTTNNVLSATFHRLDNDPRGDALSAAGTPYGPCAPIGLDIDPGNASGGDTDGVSIDHSLATALGVPQAVRARVTIEFKVERVDGSVPRSQTDINTELERQIRYPGDVASSPIPYCVSLDPADAGTDGVTDRAIHPAATDPGGRPDDTPSWCMLTDETELLDVDGDGVDEIKQTIVLDVSGDPWIH